MKLFTKSREQNVELGIMERMAYMSGNVGNGREAVQRRNTGRIWSLNLWIGMKNVRLIRKGFPGNPPSDQAYLVFW